MGRTLSKKISAKFQWAPNFRRNNAARVNASPYRRSSPHRFPLRHPATPFVLLLEFLIPAPPCRHFCFPEWSLATGNGGDQVATKRARYYYGQQLSRRCKVFIDFFFVVHSSSSLRFRDLEERARTPSRTNVPWTRKASFEWGFL